MLVRCLTSEALAWSAAVNTWRNTGQICPHWRLSSSQPGSSGDAKSSRARVADAKQCLELFGGKEKASRRERKGEEASRGWRCEKRRQAQGDNYAEEWRRAT